MAYKYNPISGQLDLVTDLTFTSITAGLGYTPVNVAGDTMLGNLILNADPSTALGAATKQYVDNIVTGLNFHSPVRVATAAPLPTVLYADGPDPLNPGVGATLTATANGALIIDGEDFSLLPVPTIPYRVMIKDQVSGLENGIYTVTVAGDSLTPFQLTRATDADNSPTGELSYGDFCFVETGIVNGGLGYILNTVGPITVGVTPISYVIFNAAQVVTAGYGLLELTPNVLSIDTSIVLDNATAALTYLTIANASLTYVPYTGATGNVDLGLFELAANKIGIGTTTPGQSLDVRGNTLIRDNSVITPLNYDLEVHKTRNGEVSGWIRNNSSGNAAFAQVGTRVDSSTQFKMGIYSSGFTTSGLITAGTAYLLSAGTNASKILIGNQTLPKDIIFINGGTAATDEIFRISSSNTIDIYDARDITFATTTGTKLGTSTTQKIGFFNATPIVQPTAVTTVQGIADALTSLGLLASSSIGSPTPNVQTVASAATVTPTSANDEVTITAQAVGLTLANPTGSPSEGQALTIRIKDNGTSQTIAYDTQYRALGVTLPANTTVSKTLYLGLIYNSTDTKWDVVGVSLEGADPFTGNDWIDYSGSSVVTGWSSTPTKVIRYRVVGKQVFFNVNISGTSNSASASFTLPFTSLRQVDVAGYGINNTTGAIIALCEISSSTSTANAYNGVGAWTASGTKSINFQFFIEIA